MTPVIDDYDPLPEGPYKGQTPAEVVLHDPQYLLDLAALSPDQVFSDEILEAAQNGP